MEPVNVMTALPLDPMVIFLVIVAGLFQKKYLDKIKINGSWKTLIVSTVFTVVYAVLIKLNGSYTKDMPMKWFLGYVTATSMYELFLKEFFAKYFPDEVKKVGILLFLYLPFMSFQPTKLTYEQQQFLKGAMPVAWTCVCLVLAGCMMLIIGKKQIKNF